MKLLKEYIKKLIKESSNETTLASLKVVLKDGLKEKNIEGRFLTPKQAEALQDEIEANYAKDMTQHFKREKDDIRMNAFNYEHPIASKEVNGVDLRIAEGLIKNKRKTYLLYADGKIIGEFYSIKDIKSIIKYIESNLVSNKKPLKENRFVDSALEKINAVGGFNNLPDIDKLALLGKMKDSEEKTQKLKRLSLRQIFRENGGTFGRFMLKVRIKPEREQPIKHKFSQEAANNEGWLYPYINYDDNGNPYVTVRFDDFQSDMDMKGGGTYNEKPIMLANMYPIDYNEINSDFVNYDKKVEFDRKEQMDSWRYFR